MTARTPIGGSVARARGLGRLAIAALVAATLTVLCPARSPAADVEAGRRKAEVCQACHGADGNATQPGMPSLAGQPTMYTHWQLLKFRDGRRQDPVMSPFAANLGDDDMADLAAYFAAQRPIPRPAAIDPTKAELGRQLADQHHCTSCHRPDLVGHQQVPRLAGQDLAYLLKLLRGFKAQTASDLDGTMTMAAQPLGDADIERLVHYLAGAGTPR
jgi:cytochrome c553